MLGCNITLKVLFVSVKILNWNSVFDDENISTSMKRARDSSNTSNFLQINMKISLYKLFYLFIPNALIHHFRLFKNHLQFVKLILDYRSINQYTKNHIQLFKSLCNPLIKNTFLSLIYIAYKSIRLYFPIKIN